MWHLVGIAVRTAFELRLYRESSYQRKTDDPEDMDHLRDQEVRQRCFWCVFAMDRIVSITLGRSLAISVDDIDTDLPSLDHENVVAEGLSELDVCQNRTAIFVHIFRYRLLCGKIMKALHGPNQPRNEEAITYMVRDSLAVELENWWRETENLGLQESSASNPSLQHRSSFLSKEWYEILFQNATLMLFRPSPTLSDISKDPTILQKVFGSGKRAVVLFASLHRSRRINYSWITLHSVFTAGLSYIYALSCHFRKRRRYPSSGAMLAVDPTTIEIVNDTRACSNVLVAVSKRWNVLRRCNEVFDRLSNAVLEDAIKLQCAPRRNRPQSQVMSTAAPTSAPTPQSNLSNNMQLPQGTTFEAEQSGNWYGSNIDLTVDPSVYSPTSPLAVDAAFRDSFGDLHTSIVKTGMMIRSCSFRRTGLGT